MNPVTRGAFLLAICAVWPMSSHAQRCGRLQLMDVDSDRVYSAHDEIRYDEPHGVFSGEMSVDTLYFVCPVRSTAISSGSATRYETFETGTVVVFVRRATDRQWTRKTFNYDCDNRTLKPEKMEWAFFNGRGLQVGSHGSVCTLE